MKNLNFLSKKTFRSFIITLAVLIFFVSVNVANAQESPIGSTAPLQESPIESTVPATPNNTVAKDSISPELIAPSGCLDVPLPTIEEQLLELKASKSISSKKYNEILKKLQDNSLETQSKLVLPLATTWSHLPGTYYCYIQAEPGFCMAASAQAVIRYLTGSCDDQYTVAEDLGVDPDTGGNFNNMKPYLNSHQSANTYVFKSYTTTQTTMKSNLYTDITTFEAPAVLRIKITTSQGWPYTTTGHALNVNAARDDKAYFQLADPVIKYLDPSGNSYYQKSSGTIYTGISANKYCGYLY